MTCIHVFTIHNVRHDIECQYGRIIVMTTFQERQLVLMRQMEQSFASNPHTATIVPMQTDFINDPQMALTAVSYLPKDIAAIITRTVIEPLKTIEPEFYYYPAVSMHITVQNVRVIHDPPRFTAADIEVARSVFRQSVKNEQPFTFSVHGILAMPTSVSIIALGTPEYDWFVKQLRKDLSNAGVPDDKSYFTDELVFANITIARFTHTPSTEFLKKLESLNHIDIGTVVIKDMHLVAMNAGANREKTTVLETYRFAEK